MKVDARRRFGLFVAMLVLVGLLAAPAAQARESLSLGDSYDISGQFGAAGPGAMEIHQASETLYIVDSSEDRILKFDISDPLNPVPADFATLGGNAITTFGDAPGSPLTLAPHANVSVDNSGGPQDGTIYLATNTATDSRLHAYSASGEFLYTFAHAADQSFDLNGTPVAARAVAVANAGPRAGEIFRLGQTGDGSSTYMPSSTPGAPPTVRLPSMVRVSPIFDSLFADAHSAGYSDQGTKVHLIIPPSFFGGMQPTMYQSSSLEKLGSYNFGSWGSPFNIKIAPDSTVLVRRSSGEGGFARFKQTGLGASWPVPKTGTEILDLFGFGDEGSGLGMAESESGYLYATDLAQNAINIFEPAPAPDAEMAEPGFVDLSTAKLRAEVDPLGLPITSCQFEWGTTTGYSNGQTPCVPTPSGSGEVTVSSADLAVVAGTTYHARVVVRAGNNTATYSPDLEWLAPDLADVVTLPAGPQQRKGTAVLGGTVNPNKTPTGYFVEYSTDPTMTDAKRYPATANEPAGNGDTSERVMLVVPGLENATKYYFRLVAETKAGRAEGAIESFTTFTEPSVPQPTSCPNAALRKGPSANLPDCRAWELVSPAQKDGGSVSQGRVTPSTDGERVAYFSATAFSDQVEGLGTTTTYFSERSASGWRTQAISPPVTLNPFVTGNGGAGYGDYTPDLSRMLAADNNLNLGPNPPTTNSTLFIWDTASRSNSMLARALAPSQLFVTASAPAFNAQGGLADDGRSGYFSAGTTIPVDHGPTPPDRGFYWWSEQDGISLASILPNGQPAPPSVNPTAHRDGLSRDGTKLLWEGGGPIATRELFLARRGGTTVRITEAQGVAPPPAAGLMAESSVNRTIRAATPDLRYVLFPSTEKLTAGSTAAPGSGDLYRYDTVSGALEDLTTTDPAGAGFERLVGLSDDGERVYFIAEGNLAPGASGTESKLYVLHDGGIRFITVFNGDSLQLSIAGADYPRLSRTSSDGRYFIFTHDGPTAGTAMESMYETNGHRLLYRYDFAEDRVDCVSCDPMGRDATADTFLTMPFRARNNGFDAAHSGRERYFMSDTGRVMFVTKQALLPDDNNQAADTYMWDGDLRLLTTGSGAWPQWAEAASDGFEEIFVLTARRLVPADIDNAVDLYVAKVGGGLAAQQVRPDQRDPACQGAACQGMGSESPGLPRLDTGTVRPAAAPTAEASCLARRNAVKRTARRQRRAARGIRKPRRVARKTAERRRALVKRHAGDRRQARLSRLVRAQRRALARRQARLKRAKRAHSRARAALRQCRNGGGK